MDDVAAKKPTLAAIENGAATVLPPRVTSSRSSGYVPPSRRRPVTNEAEDEERVTTAKRQRYWNSYEEMCLIELWRCYQEEMTDLSKPLPVYRKVMMDMRNKGVMVNSQECRRRIKTIKNRFNAEVERIKQTDIKSEWRLFPLLECLLMPKQKDFDAYHESKVVKMVLDAMPKPPELLAQLAAPSAPIPTPPRPAQMHVPRPYVAQTSAAIPTQSMPSRPIAPVQGNASIYLNGNGHSQNRSQLPNTFMHLPGSSITGKSNLPFRNITLQKYDQLKLSNEILMEERNTTMQRLRLEEQSLKAFETFLFEWAEQMKDMFNRIEKIAPALLHSKTKRNAKEETNGHVSEPSLSVN